MKTVHVFNPKLCVGCSCMVSVHATDTLRPVAYASGVFAVYDLEDKVECRRKDCDNWKDSPPREEEAPDYATPND